MSIDHKNIKEYSSAELRELMGKKHLFHGFDVFIETHRKGDDIGFMFPFRTDHHVTVLILEGKVESQWNLMTHTLKSNDMVSISGKMVTRSIDFLEDTTALFVTFTTEYALKNAQKSRALESFKLLSATSIPKISLSAQERQRFESLSTYVRSISEEDSFKNQEEEMYSHAFNLLFFEISGFYERHHPSLPMDLSRKEELSARFIKLLASHFQEHRSVGFYANELHITPGHLTKMLKKVSGKSARQLIDEAVVLEGKMLLSNPALSIAQIAHALNFSDQSFFGKFFKKETGVSPSVYRLSLSVNG